MAQELYCMGEGEPDMEGRQSPTSIINFSRRCVSGVYWEAGDCRVYHWVYSPLWMSGFKQFIVKTLLEKLMKDSQGDAGIHKESKSMNRLHLFSSINSRKHAQLCTPSLKIITSDLPK